MRSRCRGWWLGLLSVPVLHVSCQAAAPNNVPTDCMRGLVCLKDNVWLHSGELVTAPWIVVFVCSPAAVASLVLLALGALELKGSIACWCCRSGIVVIHAVFAAFWLLVLPLTIYLVANQVLVMIVFLVFSVMAVAAHSIVVASYIRWHLRSRNDQPRQQLLTARDKPNANRMTGDEEAPNPFKAPTLGLIPGTSNAGYILWLPNEEVGQPGDNREYQAAPSPTGVATSVANDRDGRTRLVPKTAQQS